MRRAPMWLAGGTGRDASSPQEENAQPTTAWPIDDCVAAISRGLCQRVGKVKFVFQKDVHETNAPADSRISAFARYILWDKSKRWPFGGNVLRGERLGGSPNTHPLAGKRCSCCYESRATVVG